MVSQTEASALYLVSTPIGNLGDITLRALETLKTVKLIACEDARTSQKLLSHYGITTKITSYHEHNAERKRPQLLKLLASGQSIALISDAGTPLISDPGYKLVQDIIAVGYPIIPIPGPSAILSGLIISGLPTNQFTFLGFLPPKQSARCKKLEHISYYQETLVFYESPKRIKQTIEDMMAVFGDRKAALGRELTKRYEECRRGMLSTLLTTFDEETTKGEMVLMIAGAEAHHFSDDKVESMLKKALTSMPVKEAAKEIATITGVSRKALYEKALKLK
jgi:16S rRNA (cytidine1402-2'-O)-methyltransferase